MMKNKKAQTIKIIIMLVIGLVVLGMMIYLGYKYILGTGEDIGQLGSCEGQGGQCKASCGENERKFFGLGCPKQKGGSDKFCCIPEDIGS
jgi:hypothetical protein